MFDRNKVYGYSWDYMVKNSFPEDNEIAQTGDESDILTMEEIERMFPEQNILLTNITYNKYYSLWDIKTAAVKMYHCNRNRDVVYQKEGDVMYPNYSGDIDFLVAGGYSR